MRCGGSLDVGVVVSDETKINIATVLALSIGIGVALMYLWFLVFIVWGI